METAINFDLFMDAEMINDGVVSDGNVVGLNNHVTTSYVPHLRIVENKVEISENENSKIKIISLEGTYLENQNIHIIKLENEISEIETKNIERKMVKGYMKMLSNFQ